MKRRSFLQSMAAFAAAPYLPKPDQNTKAALEKLATMEKSDWEKKIITLHPSDNFPLKHMISTMTPTPNRQYWWKERY